MCPVLAQLSANALAAPYVDILVPCHVDTVVPDVDAVVPCAVLRQCTDADSAVPGDIVIHREIAGIIENPLYLLLDTSDGAGTREGGKKQGGEEEEEGGSREGGEGQREA
eukprot:3288867-Rhodomonas_salina.2